MNRSVSKEKTTRAEAPSASPLSTLRSLWTGSCVRFTLLCLFMLFTSAVASDSLTVTYVDTVHFFLLLPLGFCLTVAAQVRKTDKLSAGWKYLLHPAVTLVSFYVFAYLPYQIRTNPSGRQVLYMLLLAMLVYAIVMGVYLAVTRKKRRKAIEEAPYQSQFNRP